MSVLVAGGRAQVPAGTGRTASTGPQRYREEWREAGVEAGRENILSVSVSAYDELRANVGRNCEKHRRYEAMRRILLLERANTSDTHLYIATCHLHLLKLYLVLCLIQVLCLIPVLCLIKALLRSAFVVTVFHTGRNARDLEDARRERTQLHDPSCPAWFLSVCLCVSVSECQRC